MRARLDPDQLDRDAIAADLVGRDHQREPHRHPRCVVDLRARQAFQASVVDSANLALGPVQQALAVQMLDSLGKMYSERGSDGFIALADEIEPRAPDLAAMIRDIGRAEPSISFWDVWKESAR